jgi:hypothetical protein
MSTNRLSRFVAGLLAALLLGSCSVDRAVSPPPNADLTADLLGEASKVVGTLLTCRPLPASTASAVIGSEGGTLRIGPHTLTVPRGALREPTRITATAPSDSVNSVDFQPEGLRFRKNVQITLSYANCGLVASTLPKRVMYVNDDLQILEILVSLDNVLLKKTTGSTDHFSRYAVGY